MSPTSKSRKEMGEPINGWEFATLEERVEELEKKDADKESGKQWFLRAIVIIALTQIATIITAYTITRGGK